MSIQPPQNNEWKELEQYDTGMGANFENIRDELLEEAQETAEELGFSYRPSEEEFEVYFSRDDSKAVLYAESWGGAPDMIAEVTAFECDQRLDKQGGGAPIGREIKIGNSTVEINEGALRGAAEYLEAQKTKTS